MFVQRVADQLFWKAEGVWVVAKEEAMAFGNCTPAIDLCIEQRLSGVRLWLSFEDASYDFPMEVFRAETQALVKENQELREKSRDLLTQLDADQAQAKERKKLVPFQRKEVGEQDEGGTTQK